MKLFQKRPVAIAVMVLAIIAGILLGNARRPDDSDEAATSIVGSYRYVMDSEGVISEKTMAYIENMNASLFAQTGAQIAVIVTDTTGDTEIDRYAQQEFERLGVGAAETDNGILLVLALENMYNGAPDGDYYIAWGSGFDVQEQDLLYSIVLNRMETPFAEKDYDGAVRETFDGLVSYLGDHLYGVTVEEGYIPATRQEYTAISGGYETRTTGYIPPSPMDLIVGLLVLLAVLLIIWVILDAMRYRRYRRRYMMPGMGIPTVPYYPVFWGRPRRRRPPPPPQPPRRPPTPPRSGGGRPPQPPRGGGRPPQPPRGGFGGGSFGGGGGRGGFGGGSFGGGAGRGGGGRR